VFLPELPDYAEDYCGDLDEAPSRLDLLVENTGLG
jgi:hypothetical protein